MKDKLTYLSWAMVPFLVVAIFRILSIIGMWISHVNYGLEECDREIRELKKGE